MEGEKNYTGWEAALKVRNLEHGCRFTELLTVWRRLNIEDGVYEIMLKNFDEAVKIFEEAAKRVVKK